MVRINLEKVFEATPNAMTTYREAFFCAGSLLPLFGIMANERRAAHFLAQVLHETGGLRVHTENLYYTTSAQMMKVWPSRFPTVASTVPYLRNPEGLANKVYGGRMGNDNLGDGWKYRGRGALQATGEEMYAKLTDALEVDFVSNPDLVTSSNFILSTAAYIWKWKGCNAKAEADDVKAVTKAINGGYNGLADRIRWLTKTRGMVIGETE